MIPAALAALTDMRLHRCDLTVYGLALQELDVTQHRTMKRSAMARQAGMKPTNVSRSLRRLAALGYLERGQLEGKLRTYRLAYSARVSQVIPIRTA